MNTRLTVPRTIPIAPDFSVSVISASLALALANPATASVISARAAVDEFAFTVDLTREKKMALEIFLSSVLNQEAHIEGRSAPAVGRLLCLHYVSSRFDARSLYYDGGGEDDPDICIFFDDSPQAANANKAIAAFQSARRYHHWNADALRDAIRRTADAIASYATGAEALFLMRWMHHTLATRRYTP